jgi:hypothetical protein
LQKLEAEHHIRYRRTIGEEVSGTRPHTFNPLPARRPLAAIYRLCADPMRSSVLGWTEDRSAGEAGELPGGGVTLQPARLGIAPAKSGRWPQRRARCLSVAGRRMRCGCRSTRADRRYSNACEDQDCSRCRSRDHRRPCRRCVLAMARRREHDVDASFRHRPAPLTFVASKTCAQCHPAEAKLCARHSTSSRWITQPTNRHRDRLTYKNRMEHRPTPPRYLRTSNEALESAPRHPSVRSAGSGS